MAQSDTKMAEMILDWKIWHSDSIIVHCHDKIQQHGSKIEHCACIIRERCHIARYCDGANGCVDSMIEHSDDSIEYSDTKQDSVITQQEYTEHINGTGKYCSSII